MCMRICFCGSHVVDVNSAFVFFGVVLRCRSLCLLEGYVVDVREWEVRYFDDVLDRVAYVVPDLR